MKFYSTTELAKALGVNGKKVSYLLKKHGIAPHSTEVRKQMIAKMYTHDNLLDLRDILNVEDVKPNGGTQLRPEAIRNDINWMTQQMIHMNSRLLELEAWARSSRKSLEP